jgi:hypothetical protein
MKKNRKQKKRIGLKDLFDKEDDEESEKDDGNH